MPATCSSGQALRFWRGGLFVCWRQRERRPGARLVGWRFCRRRGGARSCKGGTGRGGGWGVRRCRRALLRRGAGAREAVAVVFGDEQLSYGELEGRANQLAHQLRALGVGAESVVGVCLERSLELVVSLIAILKAGGAYLPLDPEYPAERLHYMMADT